MTKPSAAPAGPSFDVLIVGYGPAGATLANLLGRRGYRVGVVEQATGIYDKPRAITADHEVMRVFQECALADEIAQGSSPHPGTDFTGVEGQVIKRFYPQPPPNPLGWEPSWMFVQPELEAILRRGAERYDGVRVFLGHELLAFEQCASQASATIRRLADGVIQELSSRWILACDGARSPVRRSLDAAIEDLAFDEWWIVIDARLRRETDLPPRCRQYCRPSRPGTYIVGPGELRRWEIKMLPGETPQTFDDEDAIREVWSSFVDVDALELWRSAVYRFHALVVRQWRFGRVFLVGDAAHQMPPFLGQGLCAAIRDAANLAWKLDAVERLGAQLSLLDSYGDERTPHVRTIVSHAKSFGLIIGELDPAAARERDIRLGAELASGKAETVRQKFIPGLQAGLVDPDEQGRPRKGAGALFVQPWVRVGDAPWQRLDDLIGARFVIASDSLEVCGWLDDQARERWQALEGTQLCVRSPADPGDPAGSPDGRFGAPVASERFGILVATERDGLFGDWLRALDARAVVVRPDRYLFGTADTAIDLRSLIRRLHRAVFGA
ncbi:MAG TPA: bifunctional 3-(3-hydroxy-phenyl)propionate/3-hydroxycinnamic acid hydroxylase [Burkholderiaceae bacterium]|nr:bifunctional 3-(3-hydroxy-phenyl)propionate/3-hydroxycinnamic acid hydroxylase [Burkholderiaceae bacterium]